MATGRDRLVEAALAVLQSAPGQRLKIVPLNKALFYLDLIALRDLGHTVTGEKYVAIEQGPTIRDYQRRLVKALESTGRARQGQEGMSKPVEVTTPLEDFEILTAAELEIAAKVASWIAKLSAKQASELSHKNPGWDIAYRQGLGQGRPVELIDMLLAMQQVLEEDPWLREPFERDPARVVAAAKRADIDW